MPAPIRFSLSGQDNQRLANLCGPVDRHLRQIESVLDVRIARRGHSFSIEGAAPAAELARSVLQMLGERAGGDLGDGDVHLALVEARSKAAVAASHAQAPGLPAAAETANAATAGRQPPYPHEATSNAGPPAAGAPPSRTAHTAAADPGGAFASPDARPGFPMGDAGGPATVQTRRSALSARTPNQDHYIRNILANTITLGIGPAGTGKTYLAVACAAAALERDEVQRIVLTRPAVEAGERLGFLPGDLTQKVDPYLRPLYDALYDIIGFDRVTKLFEKQIIEIAPLAYMRGRTLNHSWIILDEAQNTTEEQMKMFLTRIGMGSRAVVTGDITQVDLPRNQASGLRQAARILQGIKGIGFTHFTSADVVRHPLVARIVDAYARDAQESGAPEAQLAQSPPLAPPRR